MRHFLLLLVLLSACSKAPKPDGTLRVCFNMQPATTDPRKASDFFSSTLVCLLYEGLTRCLPGGAVESALAESTEISDDQTVYLFHLRQAYWSNGKPITAYDFERSWKSILNPAGPCAFLFYPIKNAEKCAKREAPIDEVGIQAVNERTLRVELERPTPYFYSLTAFPTFLPAPPDEEPLFSGPFIIEKWSNHSEIALSKNPLFWNQSQIHVDRVQITILPDEITALHLFEQGQLDWVGAPLSPLPPDALEKLKDQLTVMPSAATTLCTFNTQTFPFNNPHLRKAFSYAINRKEIAEKVIQAGHVQPVSMLPPPLSKQNRIFFDPELAKSHFERAAIDPSQLDRLTLYYKSNQTEKRLAQTLQRQWKEILGVTVQLVQLDFKSHAQRLHHRDYQICLSSWIAQFDDPVSILDRFKTKVDHKNYPGWEDEEYIQFLNQGNIAAAEDRFADEAPLTPIYHWSSPVLCGSRIQAIASTPCGGVLFERFRLIQSVNDN